MKTLIASLTMLAIIIAAPLPSIAQSVCGNHQKIADSLKKGKYAESLAMTFVSAGSNGIIELYTNENTQTFTMLFVRPDKIACLINSGQGIILNKYQEIPAEGEYF